MGNIDNDASLEVVAVSEELLAVYETDGPDCREIELFTGVVGLRMEALMLTDLDDDGVFEIVVGGRRTAASEMRLFYRNPLEARYVIDRFEVSRWPGGGSIVQLEHLLTRDVIRGCESDGVTCYCITFSGDTVDVCRRP